MAEVVEGWVWDRNLIRLLRHLSRMVAYEFDELDQSAVEVGVQDSDAERQRWFAYQLVGQRRLDIELAMDPDVHPVLVRVSSDLDKVLTALIETLIDLLSESGEVS